MTDVTNDECPVRTTYVDKIGEDLYTFSARPCESASPFHTLHSDCIHHCDFERFLHDHGVEKCGPVWHVPKLTMKKLDKMLEHLTVEFLRKYDTLTKRYASSIDFAKIIDDTRGRQK